MLSKQILSSVPQGFRYIPNFVTQAQKTKLLQIVMSNPWCSHLRRQQQYYGIKYFQTKHPDTYLQNKQSLNHYPLAQLDFIRERVKKTLNVRAFMQNEASPNQILVNKYLKRDNLGFHVEDEAAFGDCIAGLSLGDEDYLKLAPANQFGHNKVGQIRIKMEDRSIYILEREARYKWKHGIGRQHEGRPFKQDNFMRISLTFRDVIDSRRKL